MSADNAMLDIAERLFEAVAKGDIDAVRALYAPDIAIWHNYDGQTQTADQNLATLAALPRVVLDLQYDDVRRTATTTGFVQQHVLRGRTRDGAELSVPACIVCEVRDGRITRLDEYFDSAHLAPLMRERAG